MTEAAGTAEAALAALVGSATTLAVAESLTGGLLAAEFVAVPGASKAFRGSVTAYATELKGSVLGVDRELLAARGAVDPDVAAQMARGVRRLMDADYGLATTGVAGPDPQDGQPVGTVFVAVSFGSGTGGATGTSGESVSALRLSGDRATIRRKAVSAAVELLLSALEGKPVG